MEVYRCPTSINKCWGGCVAITSGPSTMQRAMRYPHHSLRHHIFHHRLYKGILPIPTGNSIQSSPKLHIHHTGHIKFHLSPKTLHNGCCSVPCGECNAFVLQPIFVCREGKYHQPSHLLSA